MKFRITHETRYRYSAAVSRCYNLALLTPRSTRRQRCLDSNVAISPAPATRTSYHDYFGNDILQFAIQDPHRELTITSTSEVDMQEDQQPPLDFGLTCGEVRRRLAAGDDEEVLQHRELSLASPLVPTDPAFADLASDLFDDQSVFLSAVRQLSERIFTDFTFDPGFTTVATPVREVLGHRRGVCQDFAHVAIATLRSLGFVARYVSGYLETLPPPGKEKLVGADASHAWFAVFSPGEGWYEFDPTNNQLAGPQHIVTAFGRDFSDVAPVGGVIFGGGKTHQLDVGVTVERLDAPVR